NLSSGEICVQHQSGSLLEHWRQTVSAHPITVLGGAPALPHDCVMNRLACFPIPDNCGLAVISNSDGDNLIGLHPGISQYHVCSVDLRRPDIFRAMLYPAGSWIELLEFLLSNRGCAPLSIEQNRP